MALIPSAPVQIGQIPAVLYGEPAGAVWLFLHGQHGCKEEAAAFAEVVCPRGSQVLSVDLPGHGARRGRGEVLAPWTAAPTVEAAADFLRSRWGAYSVRATSIGAYFAMLALESPARALLVSPILDMEALILTMMGWAGVTEEELRRQGKISTDFGETLSWRYLSYVRKHRVHAWNCPISILCGSRDNMTPRETAESFARRYHAALTVLENGEHWFHTPQQLDVLRQWELGQSEIQGPACNQKT